MPMPRYAYLLTHSSGEDSWLLERVPNLSTVAAKVRGGDIVHAVSHDGLPPADAQTYEVVLNWRYVSSIMAVGQVK